MNLNRLFITFFGTGLSPTAPGTVGSFAALIVALAILQYFPMETLFMLILAITIIGIFQIDIYEKETNIHDSKKIVIDEFVGMWFALSIAQIDANMWGMGFLTFIYFRIFDIWKPSIIGKIDRDVKGGWGVMGDDIVAGIVAGLCASATNMLFITYL